MIDILFYWFSGLLILSAAAGVFTKNIKYSILFLMLTGFSASSLMFLIGATAFAFFSIIFYSGMIGILLFFISTFDLDKENVKSFISKKNILISIVAVIFLVVILISIYFSFKDKKAVLAGANMKFSLNNLNVLLQKISFLLFDSYSYVFEICGVILFVGITFSLMLLLKKKGITEDVLCGSKKRR